MDPPSTEVLTILSSKLAQLEAKLTKVEAEVENIGNTIEKIKKGMEKFFTAVVRQDVTLDMGGLDE